MWNPDPILLPTDFSDCADEALRFALFLAGSTGSEIHLFHAFVPRHFDVGDPSLSLPEQPELEERLLARARERLDERLRSATAQGITVHAELRRGVAESESVLVYADEIEAGLVVMGTHGHRGALRVLLGSVAESTLRRSRRPVLTVRAAGNADSQPGIGQILAPVDFSESSLPAVTQAKEIAAQFSARLHLLHVIDVQALPTFYGPGIVDATQRLESRSIQELQEMAEHSPGPTVEVECHTVRESPGRGIATFAEEQGCDLVVMPSQRRKGLERLLMGSTAERALRLSPCPVLIL